MLRTLIAEAKKQGSGEVVVAGWVRNIRVHKDIIFVDLRDISGAIQAVFVSDKEGFDIASSLTLESVIKISGTLQEKPAKKNDPNPVKDFEIAANKVELISLASENLPIPVSTKADNEASADSRFDWRWLDIRPEEHQMIFRVWTKLEEGFRDYFSQNNFIQIYTPC